MNQLEKTILDQYRRISAAGEKGFEVLEETQGEIMLVSDPDLALEILSDAKRTSPDRETRSSRAQMRAFMYDSSVTMRTTESVRIAHGLVRLNMLADKQGYTGGIIFDHGEPTVYGQSMNFRTFQDSDPIQEVMGDTFYPVMMWAKALRAEAYRNRPESQGELSIAQYLAQLGLSLGSNLTKHRDIVGATGFMPGERLSGDWGDEQIEEHIQSESIEVFRLSGLCDQAVVDPDILLTTPGFAVDIIERGGNLN